MSHSRRDARAGKLRTVDDPTSELDEAARLADELTAEVMRLVVANTATPSMALLVLANAAAQLAYQNGRDREYLLEAIEGTYAVVQAKLDGLAQGRN